MSDQTRSEPSINLSEDAFLGGRLMLRQPRKGHRAGHDAMLLAASTPARPGDTVVDFGAGVGAAGLAVAARVRGIDLTLVEIDPALCDLARANGARNGLAVRVATLDIGCDAASFVKAGLPPDCADHILMNPPFNDPARHRASPDAGRAAAHVASPTTMADWVHAARRTLKSGGTLTIIWRADGLPELLNALERGFGSLALQPVHATTDAPAIRILMQAVKGGRAPLRILPGLVLTSTEVRAALAEATALPLGLV